MYIQQHLYIISMPRHSGNPTQFSCQHNIIQGAFNYTNGSYNKQFRQYNTLLRGIIVSSYAFNPLLLFTMNLSIVHILLDF